MLILLYQDKRRLQNIYLSSFLCMFYPMASVSISLPSSCQCIPDTRLLMMNKMALCCACDRHTAPTSELTRPNSQLHGVPPSRKTPHESYPPPLPSAPRVTRSLRTPQTRRTRPVITPRPSPWAARKPAPQPAAAAPPSLTITR